MTFLTFFTSEEARSKLVRNKVFNPRPEFPSPPFLKKKSDKTIWTQLEAFHSLHVTVFFTKFPPHNTHEEKYKKGALKTKNVKEQRKRRNGEQRNERGNSEERKGMEKDRQEKKMETGENDDERRGKKKEKMKQVKE